MNDNLDFILSLSIGMAAILGVVRFSKIDKSYYPFIYSVWTSLLIEITARLFTVNRMGYGLIVLANFYYIVDFCLFFLLFSNWKLFGYNKKIPVTILLAAFVLWALTTFLITGGVFHSNYYFPVIYSFALVLFSVTAINKFIVNERANIFRNARFWICLGIIIFYTFFIVTNATWATIFHFRTSKGFNRSLHEINVFSNLLVNIMYAIAVLWIPRKKDFTSLF